MIVEIDFNSEEALYIQLINQIIIGIATDQIREGDTLPSVRQLADNIGINMHTVNKAYSVLKQEGFLNAEKPYHLSFEVKPWKDEPSEAVIANAKRTLNLAWELV